MAQTKRKRQTKHRGNAAGAVTARGRTGRKPTAAEKGASGKDATEHASAGSNGSTSRPRGEAPSCARSSRPCSYCLRASSCFLIRDRAQAFIFFPIVIILYVPVSYYTDMWLCRRRQRKQAQASTRDRAADERAGRPDLLARADTDERLHRARRPGRRSTACSIDPGDEAERAAQRDALARGPARRDPNHALPLRSHRRRRADRARRRVRPSTAPSSNAPCSRTS